MKIRTVLLITMVVLALAGRTRAHHSLLAYDQTKVVTVQGTVSRIEWINPHAAITLTVRNPEGVNSPIVIDMASPRALQQRGFDKSFVKVGDTITVDVWMLQTPPTVAGARNSASGRTLTLLDGRKLDISDNWSTMTIMPRR